METRVPGGLDHSDLTGQIIGAAIEVHSHLGPGFLESVYENALCVELRHRGLAFERQAEIAIVYRDTEVGRHRIDLAVESTVIVELKAIKALVPIHFATLGSYLRAYRKRVGLLLNFYAPTLQIRRVLSPVVPAVPPFRASAIEVEGNVPPHDFIG